MTDTNEPDVKIVERVEIAPAGGENADGSPDSSQDVEEVEGEEEKEEPEIEAEGEANPEPEEDPAPEADIEPTKIAAPNPDEKYGEIKRMPSESPREFALRLENAKIRGQLRKERSAEILTPEPAQVAAKPELSPEKKKILEQYKPEDISKLKDVFGALADDMGFVKKDQLGANAYQEKATEVLDGFLEAHPEYLPQNDPGNTLWNAFRQEYGLYRPAQNSKELKKILEKVHRDVFGIKPAAALNKQDAAKERIKVASHSGSSRPGPSREGVKRTVAPQGLRTDMLKGFSEDEIAELTGV